MCVQVDTQQLHNSRCLYTCKMYENKKRETECFGLFCTRKILITEKVYLLKGQISDGGYTSYLQKEMIFLVATFFQIFFSFIFF